MYELAENFRIEKHGNQWAYVLHQQANRLSPTSFKQWCFEHINQILPIDSGLWLSRSDMEDKIRVHWRDDTHLYNQPVDFVDNYESIESKQDNVDLLNQRLGANPGRFFSIWECCEEASFLQSDFYLRHCVPYHIEEAISALMLPSKFSAISHIFSFYRCDRTKLFTQQEKAIADFILPHLLVAYSSNILHLFETKSETTMSGVVDRFGKIVVAEERFIVALEENGYLTDSKVNFDVIHDLTDKVELELADLKLKFSYVEGLIYIDIREPSPMELLTVRQREIGRLVAKGFASKEIASYLEISPATVNNHIQKIFTSSYIRNRVELTKYLVKHGFG